MSTPPTLVQPEQPIRGEAQTDTQSRSLASVATATGSSDLLYVGNVGNNSITVYHHDSKGNAAPIAVIAGSKTGLNKPGQLSQDAQGNLYVANGSERYPSLSPAILVFAHGATGNVSPIRKIAGSVTGLHDVQALTVDKSTGKVFVFDNNGAVNNPPFPALSLLRFAPNANGNVAPLARSAPQAAPAVALTSDSTGSNVIEVTDCAPSACNQAAIRTSAKQFSGGAQLIDLFYIGNFGVSGIADDPTTKSYLASHGDGIYRFAEKTNGFGGDSDGGPASFSPAPISVITSDTCSGQLSVAPGPTPYTYALHPTSCMGHTSPAVYVYANNASGNAIPVRVLSGSATLLNQPFGIVEGS